MTISTSISDLEPQFANAHAYWLGWGGTEGSGSELTLYRSGVAHPQLNGVLRLRDGEMDRAIAEARKRLDGVPWMWWVGHDSRPGVSEDLLAHGATAVGAMPVMAVEIDRVTEIGGPPELTIEEVSGPDALADWVQAYGPSYGVTPEQNEDVTRLEGQRPDPPDSFVRLAGRVGGRVVGSAAMLAAHGVAGIYVVTTAEDHRRRGIGARLTAAALRAGRERGLRIGTLQATGAGAPVYQRMGFEKVSEYHMFQTP